MLSLETIAHINAMKHSPAHNYVIPGLTSWLIGTPNPKMGCVRLFTMSRFHEEPIVPHSHRFDFRCVVLKGFVTNRIWRQTCDQAIGDKYELSDVTYEGELGKHQRKHVGYDYFRMEESIYNEGEEYGMRAEEFHSIYFSRGAMVLFFEGPNRLELSQVLEPVVNEMTIPLFKTEPWMFAKD